MWFMLSKIYFLEEITENLVVEILQECLMFFFITKNHGILRQSLPFGY